MAHFNCIRRSDGRYSVSWVGKDRNLSMRSLARALGLPDSTQLPKIFRVGIITPDGKGHQVAKCMNNSADGLYTVALLGRGRVPGEPMEIYAKGSGEDGQLITRKPYANVGEFFTC